MRVAAAGYPMEVLPNWAFYAKKLERWVEDAAGRGAELLVFPEYGAMEIATLDGPEIAGDLERSLQSVSARIPDVDDLHADLAACHGVHILAASAPVFDAAIGPRPVNRARLFAPGGGRSFQDKQIMTRFEREDWDVVRGAPLRLFDTALGRIGVLICYDAEFPLLARALVEAGAEMLLVPSCTEAETGYWRVRLGAMARALESQCAVVMSSTVGDAAFSEAVDTNVGAGGVFGPPDIGFPSDGILACGALNRPGWTCAEVESAAAARVRTGGVVRNLDHWSEQTGAAPLPEVPIVSVR